LYAGSRYDADFKRRTRRHPSRTAVRELGINDNKQEEAEVGTAPSQQEVLEYFDTLSNWGRWGDNDVKGTLNLITPEKRLQAVSLVKDGEPVSCSRVISRPPPYAASIFVNHMVQSGERYALGDDGPAMDMGGASRLPLQWAGEYLAFQFHGVTFTHIDALGHVFWKGKTYNGISAATVKASEGSTVENINVAAPHGILTKGVLLDIARLRGKPWLDADDHVFPEDLDAAEQAQGVRVEAGDVLLLRTGYPAQIADALSKDPMAPPPHEHSGYSPACLPWFRERDIALLGSDVIQDAMPHAYHESSLPVHQVAIVALGMRLIDNADLEALSEACARKNRWEFCFSLNPLRIENGTGSPANPIALF
jgi:kynurenine formamidase